MMYMPACCMLEEICTETIKVIKTLYSILHREALKKTC